MTAAIDRSLPIAERWRLNSAASHAFVLQLRPCPPADPAQLALEFDDGGDCGTCDGDKRIDCEDCDGDGERRGRECGTCDGEGSLPCPDCVTVQGIECE